MGKEISQLAEINQWEAYNHAEQVKLWLHDIVDEEIVPGLLTIDTLFKSIDMTFEITGITGITQRISNLENWQTEHNSYGELPPHGESFYQQSYIDDLESRIEDIENNPTLFVNVGEIRIIPGGTAYMSVLPEPGKWQKCNGGTASRTFAADLFALIGTTYGDGDGSTTFNLPDFTGTLPADIEAWIYTGVSPG